MSTTSTYGRLGEYNPESDDWTEYVEQMEHFLAANDTEAKPKKKAILLSSCGTKTYSLIRSLVAPSKPGTKTFKKLVDVITAHQNPKPSVIMERYRLNKRDSELCESIAQYVTALRRLSEHGDTLTDMIKDRLVCGIRNDHIQQCLLAESTLTSENAIKIATSMERKTISNQ